MFELTMHYVTQLIYLYIFQGMDESNVLFTLSGSDVPADTVYVTSGHEVTLTFTTDSATKLKGWEIEWRKLEPTTTTSTTVPPTPSRRLPSFTFLA